MFDWPGYDSNMEQSNETIHDQENFDLIPTEVDILKTNLSVKNEDNKVLLRKIGTLEK